jgi:hypothetical protein
MSQPLLNNPSARYWDGLVEKVPTTSSPRSGHVDWPKSPDHATMAPASISISRAVREGCIGGGNRAITGSDGKRLAATWGHKWRNIWQSPVTPLMASRA